MTNQHTDEMRAEFNSLRTNGRPYQSVHGYVCGWLQGVSDAEKIAYTATTRYEAALRTAIELLDCQRNKPLYPMDEQIKTSKQVKEFIERHRNEK